MHLICSKYFDSKPFYLNSNVDKYKHRGSYNIPIFSKGFYFLFT